MSNFVAQDFLNWAFRLTLAQGLTIFFLLLNVASFSLPHASDYKPFFLLMAVYYWSIYRPTVMPFLYTFVLGLVMDLLTSVPPGLNALSLVLLQMIVQKSRLFLMGQPYIMVWLGFVIVCFVNALFIWLVMCGFTVFTPVWPSLIAALLSIFIFPLVSLALHSVHKILPMTANPFRAV